MKYRNFLVLFFLVIFSGVNDCQSQINPPGGLATGVFLSPDKNVYVQGSGPAITAQLNHITYPAGETIRLFVMKRRSFGLEPVIEHGPFTSAPNSWTHPYTDTTGAIGKTYYAIAFKLVIVNGQETWHEIDRSHDYEFKRDDHEDPGELPRL